MIVCFIHFDYVHSLSLVHVRYFLNDTIVFLAPPLTQYPVGSRRNSPYGSAGTFSCLGEICVRDLLNHHFAIRNQ